MDSEGLWCNDMGGCYMMDILIKVPSNNGATFRSIKRYFPLVYVCVGGGGGGGGYAHETSEMLAVIIWIYFTVGYRYPRDEWSRIRSTKRYFTLVENIHMAQRRFSQLSQEYVMMHDYPLGPAAVSPCKPGLTRHVHPSTREMINRVSHVNFARLTTKPSTGHEWHASGIIPVTTDVSGV